MGTTLIPKPTTTHTEKKFKATTKMQQ